jgi:hypothetical protein
VNDYPQYPVYIDKKNVKKYSVKTFVSLTADDVGTSGQPGVSNIFANFAKLGS